MTKILKQNRHRFPAGVIHCFTNTEEELKEYLELGLYIGVTALSFKTEENIRIAKKIPLDRLMLETDCPFCQVN